MLSDTLTRPGVTEAILGRRSVRAFLPSPVPETLIREILDLARYAPSGSNMQPWFVNVLAGDALEALKAAVKVRIPDNPAGEGAPFTIYPEAMSKASAQRRSRRGEDMYALLGIPRENKVGRIMQFARNYDLFGAPMGLFFSIDRVWDKPQWAHLGMFIHSIMLLAHERGLATCAQESWAGFHPTVTKMLDLPESRIFYCGMAIGYADPDAPVNALAQDRIGLDEFSAWRLD